MYSIGLLLMSHGDFAKAALESAQLIVGEQENIEVLSVFLVDQVESLRQEMIDKADKLDTSKGLLILTDIIGGTPTNLASSLLVNDNIIVCSGLNLPVLLEVLMNRNRSLEEIKEKIQNAYTAGLTIRSKEDIEMEDDEDDSL
ncbi:PTS sugar transporter subunit IIA [Enterococcus gilvus]|uniref:PTS sugar transporter subunit IIA n=1 Tax=Enterococcus gilvus TaxID=160453 RepID=UPI003EDA9F16